MGSHSHCDRNERHRNAPTPTPIYSRIGTDHPLSLGERIYIKLHQESGTELPPPDYQLTIPPQQNQQEVIDPQAQRVQDLAQYNKDLNRAWGICLLMLIAAMCKLAINYLIKINH